jgi:hypothetical protein
VSDPRWRVGQKLGRTLYRQDRCVGMVDTPELASEIVAAMNGAAPNDRESIAKALSREANRIFNKQARDFPSNVLDALALAIRAGATENLTVWPDGFPKPKLIEEGDAAILLRAATSFRFQGADGTQAFVGYDSIVGEWWVSECAPGRSGEVSRGVHRPFRTQAEALAEARRLTAVAT